MGGGGEGGSGVEPCYSKITTVIASNKRVRWCSRLAVKQLSPDRNTVLVTKLKTATAKLKRIAGDGL